MKINDICKNLKEYHPNKRRKILIVSNVMIHDMINHKNLKPIVTKLFIRHRKYIYITRNVTISSSKSTKTNEVYIFSFRKSFRNKEKTIEDQGKK